MSAKSGDTAPCCRAPVLGGVPVGVECVKKSAAKIGGTRSAPAGFLAARPRGSERENAGRRGAHPAPRRCTQSNCLIQNPFARTFSTR
jgi:hypothetical protein